MGARRGPRAHSEPASQQTRTTGSGSSVYVRWVEWLVVALFAAGAFLVTSALSRDTRRPLLRVAGGLLLPLIGLAAWFGDLG